MSVPMGIAGGIARVDMPIEEVDGNPEKIYQRDEWGLRARVSKGVSFEEYQYWAAIERELEIEENKRYIEKRGPWTIKQAIKGRFSKGIHEEARIEALRAVANEKDGKSIVAGASLENGAAQDPEWRVAARALRTASWGTMFYLITTDILGWGGTP